MNWDKINITKQDGEVVEAQAPIIISASRSTDIPAFYSDWFIQRIKEGYVKWKNPFNGVPLYVSFNKARLIIFWSKNPKSMLKHLDYLDERIKNYYFQYTLNDYDIEKLEPNVPNVQSRIETFIELSERIGKGKVIWRFDPLILTDKIGVDELLKKVENIGNHLKNHTEKMVFSFADIKLYKKVQNNPPGKQPSYSSNTWKYDVINNFWSMIATNQTKSENESQSDIIELTEMAYTQDTLENFFYVFGGKTYNYETNTEIYSNEIYKLDLNTFSWTKYTTTLLNFQHNRSLRC
jgi:hypothetical protein